VRSLGTSDEREAPRRKHTVLARIAQELDERRRQLAHRAE
jgi:hypothetical protein